MKIGPFEFNWNPGKKSYSELVRMINMEKSAGAIDPRTNPISQLKEYKSWVSSCTSLIKDRVMEVPFKFYREGTEEEISSGSHALKFINPLFKNPNPLMTFNFIKAFCQLQLDLCGMAAIYKARNVLGEIRELWPLNMNWFSGIYNSKGIPITNSTEILPSDVYYVFQYNGQQYTFRNSELMLLYYQHPKDLFLGASPIQQQAYAVDTQNYIEIYERDFFANSARIDMVLKTDATIEESKAKEIKERWLSKFRGKFHDVAVLDSGLTPVPLKYTNQDFQFLELAGWTRDMVVSAYRVPLGKLGLSGSDNRQNSVYVDINFNKECIAPRLSIWDDELTQIVREFDKKIVVKHDNPIPRDRQLEVQEARIYLSGFPTMTPNEFRKRIHKLPPIDKGDELYVPSSFVPFSKLEKLVNSQLQKPKPPKDPNDTDPNRHDGDTPHVNPDDTDDRDDLPTSGRIFLPEKTTTAEFYLRNVWNSSIKYYLKDAEVINLKLHDFFKIMITNSINLFLKYNDINIEYDINDWINNYSRKLSVEYENTLGNISKDNMLKLVDSNSRLSKICNTAIRSCINYSKFLVLKEQNLDRIWIINSNECGHKGRMKNLSTNTIFKLGNSDIRFPGELFNLNCDCTISVKEEL